MTDLVVDSAASVGVVAHPSLLEVPKDIEDLNRSSGYFLWLNAGDDYMFNKEKQDQAREIIKGNDKHKMVGESVVVRARRLCCGEPPSPLPSPGGLAVLTPILMRALLACDRLRGGWSRLCDPRRPQGRARAQVCGRRVRAVDQLYQSSPLMKTRTKE